MAGVEARAWAAEQKAAKAAGSEDEAEAQLEAAFAAVDRAAAEKELQAAMPGWFSSADPERLAQAVAAGRHHGASAALLGRAEEALAKARAADIYVEFPAVAVGGAAVWGAGAATSKLSGGGRSDSPASSMQAEQGSVYARRPTVAPRLGRADAGASSGGAGGAGGADFLARLEELEQRCAQGVLSLSPI